MSEIEEKSKGTALLLSSLFGPFGIDKFYVGATAIGLIQLIMTLSVIFSPISFGWATLSTFTLLFMILLGWDTFLYPKVKWAETNKTDKGIAWVLVGFLIVSYIVTITARLIMISNPIEEE